MSRFATAAHLAAWVGLAPGNNESAGKRYSGRTRKGNPWLRSTLVQAARGAVRTKGSYFGAQYRRLVRRIGDKRAIVAVAHSLLVVIYHMLKDETEYNDLGDDYFERKNPTAVVKRLTKQLEKRGYQVRLTPVVLPAVSDPILAGGSS